MTSEISYPFLSGLIQGAMIRRAPLHSAQTQTADSQVQFSHEANGQPHADSLAAAHGDVNRTENTAFTVASRVAAVAQREHIAVQDNSVLPLAPSQPQTSIELRRSISALPQVHSPAVQVPRAEPFAKAESIVRHVRAPLEFDGEKSAHGSAPPSQQLDVSQLLGKSDGAIAESKLNQSPDMHDSPAHVMRERRVAAETKVPSVAGQQPTQNTPGVAATSVPNIAPQSQTVLSRQDTAQMRIAPAPQVIREPTGGVHIGRVNVTVIAEKPRVAQMPPAPLPTVRTESLHYLRRF